MGVRRSFWKYWLIALCLAIIGGCYFWLACREYCMNQLFGSKEVYLASIWLVIKKLAMVFLLFILFKILNHMMDKSLKFFVQNLGKSQKYQTIRKLASFVLWTFFIVLALSMFVGNLTALVASLGLVGFGLTLALQKPILNFVGWLTILFKDLYSEGDRIKINGVVGDVKEIQVMNTIIFGLLESSEVLSGKIVSFPNELVLSTDVENYTKDSNYIVNELKISITYESDYHKAMKLLRTIILNVIENNKSKYIKKIYKQKSELDNVVSKWLSQKKRSRSKVAKKEQQLELEKLKNEKDQLEQNLIEVEEEFQPAIRVEMLDSAIELIAQFKCPYNEIKKNRTEINLKFLDMIKDDRSIEVAYPHLQLVKGP